MSLHLGSPAPMSPDTRPRPAPRSFPPHAPACLRHPPPAQSPAPGSDTSSTHGTPPRRPAQAAADTPPSPHASAGEEELHRLRTRRQPAHQTLAEPLDSAMHGHPPPPL